MSIDVNKGIVIEAFTKIYGKGTVDKAACRDLDFSAKVGQVVGLLGPNGAGKSTLLKALCGFHYPSGGSVSVCGSSDFREIRQITGYVPEFPSLDKRLTVLETLYLEAKIHGVPESGLKKNIEKALHLAELEDVVDKKVGALSKGYAQRTSFAKAVCHDPCVLILDEFSGGLDPAQTAKMRKNIKKLSSDKIIIQSTHRIEEAEQLCDYLYIMDRGSFVARGSSAEIIRASGKRTLEEAFISLTHSGE